MELTPEQSDRARGVLVGAACGDALGAGYEFAPPRISGEPVAMVGGGPFNWAPGEWTDDTSMTVCVARAATTGDLRDDATLDQLVRDFLAWAAQSPDVGAQTSRVFAATDRNPSADAARAAARREFESTRLTGNGSLMRTAPIALAYLNDTDALVQAAHAVSALTHGDEEAGEACALWCLAIQHAVLHGSYDGLRRAVDTLSQPRAEIWHERLDEAERVEPHHIPSNGWVVAALQAAWSAITRSAADDPADALDRTVRCGNDTDTVAAIAGALVGARCGLAALPPDWRAAVHGWPGMRAHDLTNLADRLIAGSAPAAR